NLTGLNTGIIGHPKMHFEAASMPKSYKKKAMLTTGAITLPNYTESRIGIRGESKHKLGFSIVEIKDEEIFYIRQVEAEENGSFYDLKYRWDGEKISKYSERALGVVLGDTHIG